MKRARHASAGARPARLAAALLVISAVPARADDAPQLVVVPTRCAPFMRIPGGRSSPAAWDTVISFAACIQDGSVSRVEHAAQLDAFVEQLETALEPSLELYATALEAGSGPVQLRAAYHIGLAHVALATRARASIASRDLRAHLERLLEPDARLAYLIFRTIERAAILDPSANPDVVTRYMVRSAHELADSLQKTWPFEGDNQYILATLPSR